MQPLHEWVSPPTVVLRNLAAGPDRLRGKSEKMDLFSWTRVRVYTVYSSTRDLVPGYGSSGKLYPCTGTGTGTVRGYGTVLVHEHVFPVPRSVVRLPVLAITVAVHPVLLLVQLYRTAVRVQRSMLYSCTAGFSYRARLSNKTQKSESL